MNLPNSFTPSTTQRHRRKRKQSAVVPTPPSPFSVKDVLDVNFEGPSGSLEVLFDIPDGGGLNNPVDGGADPAKWTALVGGTLYIGSFFVFDGGPSLIIHFMDYGSGTGSDVLNYSADPSDITDTAGASLAAVVDYPI